MPYPKTYYSKDNFSLSVQHKPTTTRIQMRIFGNKINTYSIPHTYNILQNLLPGVLSTQCFNDKKLPFHIEVKNTEIGHLFEHILLEYLCQIKISKGFSEAEFTGRTRWNWQKDPKGTFYIHINCPLKDADILSLALKKSIKITKIILSKNPRILHQNFIHDLSCRL